MSTRHPGFLRRPELWALAGILILTAVLRTWHLVESEANDPFFYHPSEDIARRAEVHLRRLKR